MLKHALRQFFTYGSGSIAQTSLSFILLPLYLRFFEPAEYGVIALLLAVVSLLGLLAHMGMVSGLYRLYYGAKIGERKKLVGTTWFWYLFGAILGGAILFIYSSSISQLLFHSGDYSYPIRLVSGIFFFSMLEGVSLNVLRLEKKSGLYVGLSLVRLSINFGLKIYFIVSLGRGVAGYFESGVIAHGIALCFLLFFTLKYVSFSLNASYLKQLLRLGFPFVFSAIAVWTLEVSDRFILNLFWGGAAVGIYSLGYKFADLFKIFLFNPSALFWSPFFFSYAADRSPENTKKLLSRALVYFFVTGCILYLVISLGSGDVLRIITSLFAAKEGYLQAAMLVPLLTLGPFLYMLSRQAGDALLMAKKPEFTAIAACIAAAANVGLNFIFIPRFGAMGAAITTVIAYVLFNGLCYWWAQRIWPVNHDWKGIAKSVLFLAVAFVIGWQIVISQPWVSLFARMTAGVAVFGLCTWFITNILTKAERDSLIAYVADGRRKLLKGLIPRW